MLNAVKHLGAVRSGRAAAKRARRRFAYEGRAKRVMLALRSFLPTVVGRQDDAGCVGGCAMFVHCTCLLVNSVGGGGFDQGDLGIAQAVEGVHEVVDRGVVVFRSRFHVLQRFFPQSLLQP